MGKKGTSAKDTFAEKIGLTRPWLGLVSWGYLDLSWFNVGSVLLAAVDCCTHNSPRKALCKVHLDDVGFLNTLGGRVVVTWSPNDRHTLFSDPCVRAYQQASQF